MRVPAAESGAEAGEGETLPGPPQAQQALAGCLSEGVALLERGRLAWANAALIRMSGHPDLPALAGTPLAELFADTGSGLPGEGRPVECLLRRADGGSRRVKCRPAEAEGSDSLWLVEDVGRLRSLETELLQVGQALRRANADAASLRERLRCEHGEREEFLTVLSHELRTPVTVIRGYNRLLLSGQVGELSAEQRRFLEESTRACERLAAFIESLVEIARVEEGDEVLELGTHALEPVVDNVARLMKPLLDERGLVLDVELPAGAAHARFDRLRVERVLTNLVGNAVKFAPADSRIQVAAQLRRNIPGPGGPPRDFVEVSVSDAGPGVSREEAARIFEPYARGAAGCDSGGLGLGLAISRRLVQAHGGTIWVEPREGGGSCFRFTLPAPESSGGQD